MGTVYLARSATGRLVAVKVIRPEYAYEDEFRARFRSEVNRARQVPPFCTAELLDADPDHRTPYLVVEYVDGPSLAEVVGERGPLTAGNLHSVAVGVATALAAIHGAGGIHRDLKPRNVLFSLGTPKVIDFGIARALEATSQHTRTDQMVGTVAYMAPERFDTHTDRAVSPAADIFAWGAVVAYAGTGRTPFQADSAAATAARILTQPPDLSGLPGSLRDLVAQTLAKDPQDRPTAYELLDLLLAAGPQADGELAQLPELRRAAEAARHTGRYPTGATRRGRKRATRRRAGWIAAAAIAAVLAAAGGLFATGSGRRVLAAFEDSTTGRASAGSTAYASVAPSAVRVVQGPTVIDALDRPGQWSATKDVSGRCAFADGHLVATPGSASWYQCAGAKDIFSGNLSAAVDVTVLSPNACALIWFRYVSTSGYRVSLCSTEVKIGLDNEGEVNEEFAEPSTAFRPGQRHRVGIEIHNDSATVTVDDGSAPLTMGLTDPSLAAGQVVLGTYNDTGDGGSAAFAKLEIRSL